MVYRDVYVKRKWLSRYESDTGSISKIKGNHQSNGGFNSRGNVVISSNFTKPLIRTKRCSRSTDNFIVTLQLRETTYGK